MFAILLAAAALLAQDLPLIDLVTEPARPGKERPVTFSFGGWSFHNPKPTPRMPFQVHLESIAPNKELPSVKVVQILIKNTGTHPYALPVDRDGDLALRPTNRGRHEFWFGLVAPRERYPYLSGMQTFSSADLPGSVMLIPPNGVVRVRFSIHVNPSGGEWKGEGGEGALVAVRARCEDLPYDDNPNEYVYHTPTPEAVSDNELRMPLK